MLSFYATRQDLIEILSDFEQKLELEYYPVARYSTPDVPVLYSLITEDLGKALTGETITNTKYYVLRRGAGIKTRFIGGVAPRFIIDHHAIPNSISIIPSGIYEDRHIIGGEVRASSNDPDAVHLLKELKKCFVKRCNRVRTNFLGPEAEKLFDEGWILTGSIKQPPQYNLAR